MSLLRVSTKIQSRFSLGLRGYELGGSPIALGTFCMIRISYGIASIDGCWRDGGSVQINMHTPTLMNVSRDNTSFVERKLWEST